VGCFKAALGSVDFLRNRTSNIEFDMTKAFLKITTVCAACSMLAASAWAQAESQDKQSSDSSANRSWSTKHLSATGRDGGHSVCATQLSGSAVNDSSGKRIATIEDTLINPSSGRVDFALLSLNGADEQSSSTYSGNTSSTTPQSSKMATSASPSKLVPVPWSLLKTASGSSQYMTATEKPTFTLNVEQSKLSAAPSVSESDLRQSEWQQRVYSYYGVTPGSPTMGTPSMGGSESPQGEIKGKGARNMENSTPERQQPTVP
jgi:sporulation protein YlmC with PRC-barrel domain